MLYNDAYRGILGSKHPQALGASGAAVWPEIWDIIGPMLQGVLADGEATWSDDQLLLLDRNGYREECYFTFSYSPIRDESGGVGGVFTAVHETTDRVVDERRLQLLRAVAADTAGAASAEEVCQTVAAALAGHPDAPAATVWLVDEGQTMAACSATAVEVPAVPGAGRAVLPLEQAALPGPFGYLAVELNPRRPYTPRYADFLQLLASGVASAIADARADEAERRRLEALAELDRAKTTFFGNVSHELRTPLTLILGPLSQLIEHREPGPERSQLEIAHRNALRLLRLVNELLDFSRAGAGTLGGTYAPIDLPAVTAELASTFRSAVEAAGLALVVETTQLPRPVYVDADAWEKVVMNLLSNALKFTFAGEIRVTVDSDRGEAVVRVADTGTGIPQEELPNLFERFHRVRGAVARTHEGTGIGLALVRELVELHGGRIDVESSEGHGTTFTVRVPFGHEHLPASDVRHEPAAASGAGADAFVQEALRWLPEDSRAPRGGSGPRIVVADDNADMLDYVRRLLEPSYRVETYADGAAALAAIRAHPPQLVLSDVMMPRLDGLELLAALRADEELRHLPVILLSARAGAEATVDGLDRGADDYLVKPFGAAELLARVRTVIQLSQLRSELGRIAALEQVRTHVVTTVSHELRTPIASIFGAAKTLARPDLEDAGTRQRLMEVIEHQADRLSRLVADVLSAGSLAAGSVAVVSERVELGPLLDELLASWHDAAAAGRLRAQAPAGLAVLADPDRLRQVLVNLVENATKYAPQESAVLIDAGRTDGHVRVAVSDEGPGVPASERERIFERFYRLDPELASGVGGTGLGLSISRALVQAMGGRIWVEAREPAGSRFVLELPAAPCQSC